MCQAIPRKVVKISEGKAEVETTSGTIEVNLLDDKTKVGDYLLVHGNLGMNKVSKKEAEAILAELDTH